MADDLPPVSVHQRLPVWLTLMASLLLTVATWYGLTTQAQHNARQQFQLHAEGMVNLVRDRIYQHEQLLLAAAGMMEAQGEAIRRREWRDYADRLQLQQRYPGILGLGYARVIRPAELAAHVAALRAEGFADYNVWPPGVRDLFTAIVYLEPFSGPNRAVLGYDMLSEPTRAKAMRRAVETGQPAITGRVLLVQEAHRQAEAGFVMYVPVYRTGLPLQTAEQRWAALRGFVYIPYRMRDFMGGLVGTQVSVLNLVIYDGDTPSAGARMYDTRDLIDGAVLGERPRFVHTQGMVVNGQRWTLVQESRPEFETGFQTALHGWVLVLGGVASVLLTLLVNSLVSRRDRAELLVAQRTAEIRRNEDRLRQNELHLLEAQRTAQLGSWELDLLSGELFWSDEIFRIFEIDKSRFNPTYQGFLDAVHPDDLETVNAAYNASLANRLPYQIRHRLRMADGRVKWVQERGTTDFGVDGTPLRSRGTVQDITVLVQAEHAAQDSAQLMQLILDHVADGIVTFNDQGSVTSLNAAAERLFGVQASDVTGWNVNLLLPQPTSGSRLGLPESLGQTREQEGVRRDGSRFPVELVVTCGDHDGQPLFIGLVRDITERKRVERMKTEFVSTVSHELRTPLTSVRGALGLMMGGALGKLPEQALTMLRIASNNTERLLLLINDILDIQKIDADQMVFHFEPLVVSDFLRQVLADMSAYGQLHGVQFELVQDEPGLRALADHNRLAQVMANLLSNAAKFSMPGQRVEVAAALENGRVRIRVTDHGSGIPPEFQPRLFERFTQADSSDSRSKGGTGLGLAISKAIVEKHGGRISFVSPPGQGATFYVDLPALRQAGPPVDPAPAEDDASPKVLDWMHKPGDTQRLQRIARGITVPPGERPQVLHVEDDPDVRHIARTLLQDDCDVAACDNLAQARRMLLANRYALVLLDLQLLDGSGLDLLPVIEQQTPPPRVVIFSASDLAPEDAARVNAVLVKSRTSNQRLVEVLRDAVRPT